MLKAFLKKKSFTSNNSRIYLDFAAATPLGLVARSAMLNCFDNCVGNASAIHTEGQTMRRLVESARKEVATCVQVQSDQVIFTSGGTESNNLAIVGVIEGLHHSGRAYSDMQIITTSVEHPATKNTVASLMSRGVMVEIVPVDNVGNIVQSELQKLITKNTVLVCVSYVNSEIGTIESVSAIGRLLHKHAPDTLLFVDAAQAPLWLPCVLPQLRADILTFDAGKFCGPQGIGIVVMSKRVHIRPISYGGGQEHGLRPGTEPTALIVGAVAAFVEAQRDWAARSRKVSSVRDYTISQLIEKVDGAILNGSSDNRVANNINISIPGLDSEYTVVTLDIQGVAASTKSACSSASGGQSAVVMATTNDSTRASSTLRFTLGPDTTVSEIDKMVAILQAHLAQSSSH